MLGHRPARDHARRAAAAVEFAVVAPLLFVLLLGIIEFGRGMMVIELLNSAARNGARVGALQGTSTATINTAVSNALTNSGVNGATTTVLVNGASADASTAQTGDAITVSVSVPYNSVSWLPTGFFLENSNLGTNVVMRRE
jgi:Flp pilus assembly protein TadG